MRSLVVRLVFSFLLVFAFGGLVTMTRGFDLSDVKTFTALNTSVILRSTPAFGEIVAFQITARGGATLTDRAGLMELLIKTLSGGTPSYSKEQIDQILTESGAAFSVEPRNDYVDVSVKCLKKYLPTILPVVSEMIRVPLLTPEEVELSRKQMFAELKNEQDHPDSVLQLVANKEYYKNHPYNNRSSGYLESLGTLKREELIDLLPKVFNLKNIFFTMVGDFSDAEAKSIVETYFSKIPADGPVGALVTKAPEYPVGKMLFAKFDAPTTYFMAKFKAPSLMDSDYPAMTLASQILDNRLFEEVRTKRGLTYAVSAGMGNSLINSGSLYVSSTQIPEAVKVIYDEVRRIQSEPIDPMTLELQVRKFTSSWFLGRETASSQARIFAMYQVIGNGYQNSNSFIERLSKVTPADVTRVAKKYFADMLYTVAGPKELALQAILPDAEKAAKAEAAAGTKPAPATTPTANKVKVASKPTGTSAKDNAHLKSKSPAPPATDGKESPAATAKGGSKAAATPKSAKKAKIPTP